MGELAQTRAPSTNMATKWSPGELGQLDRNDLLETVELRPAGEIRPRPRMRLISSPGPQQ